LIEKLGSTRAENRQWKAKVNRAECQREGGEQRPEQASEHRFEGQPSGNMFQGVGNVNIDRATFTMVVNSQPDEGLGGPMGP